MTHVIDPPPEAGPGHLLDAHRRDHDTAATTPTTPPDVVYVLVFNPPEAPAPDYGVGWTVVAWHGDRWRWSVALAARGAGAHAGPRVAKAVAVRVLGAQGVPVEDWHGAGGGELSMFRARLRSEEGAAGSQNAGVPVSAPPGSAHPAGGSGDGRRWWRRGASPR